MGMTKATDECLTKVKEDEPIFVLRAQDELAPRIVQEWAYLAARAGTPKKKVVEAFHLAEAMMEWQQRNPSKIPD